MPNDNSAARERRGRLRGKITKYCAKLESLDTADMSALDRDLWRLKVEKLEAEMQQLNVEVSETTPAHQIAVDEATQKMYADKLAVLQRFVDQECRGDEFAGMASAAPIAVDAATLAAPTAPVPPAARATNIRAKLPTLEVPLFSGDLLEWADFITTFEMLIHSDQELSSVQKFMYLKKYVKGKARDVVASLGLSDGNYALALRLLKRKYDRPEIAESQLLQELYNLPPARGKHDAGNMRQIADTFAKNLAALERLGVPSASYGRNVYNVLLRTLPREMVHDAVRRCRDGSSSEGSIRSEMGQDQSYREYMERVRAICDVLEEYLETEGGIETEMQMCMLSKHPRVGNVSPAAVTGPPVYPRKVPTIAFATHVKVEESCVFCGDSHQSRSCKKGMSVQERRDKIHAARACFRCFGKGHQSRWCRERVKCSICHKPHHHTLLHQAATSASPVATPASPTVVNSVMTKPLLLMQTALVVAEGPGTARTVRAILDPGSQTSFIREQLAVELRLKRVGESNMEIYTIGSSIPLRRSVPAFELTLRHASKGQRVTLTVHGLAELNESLRSAACVPRSVATMLAAYELADQVGKEHPAPVEVLIGVDALARIYTNDHLPTVSPSFVLTSTVFGIVITGSVPSMHKNADDVTSVAVNTCFATKLDAAVENLWALESVGIDSNDLTRDKGEEVRRVFDNTVQRVDGRYSVHVPVCGDISRMGNNYRLADRRLQYQLRSLIAKPDIKRLYDNYMQKYVDGDFVEPVPPAEINKEGMVYYMPHHPVIRPDSTSTPLRVVFDCASRMRGTKSLNDCLDKGPNLNNHLVGVLLRFREGAVAVTADIEKAFLQVGIDTKFRDLFRYLWTDPEGRIKQLRFKTVPFGAVSSPFLLLATLQHHLRQYAPEQLRDLLCRSFYMDDLVVSCSTVDEAVALKEDTIRLLHDARMNLTKWASNEPSLCDESQVDKTNVKILGVTWNRIDDQLSVQAKGLTHKDVERVTKRSLLCAVAAIFDPLGYLSPVACRGKVLFQECCRRDLLWDENLDKDMTNDFHTWSAGLPQLVTHSFPRQYAPSVAGATVELHLFSDFSPKAYATVAYLRVAGKEGVNVAFVMARHRLPPLRKTLSVPRGELVASLLGARLAEFLVSHLTLNIKRITMWADATIALAWVRGDPARYNVFVANRMREIQHLTSKLKLQWRHCPGDVNPADRATRGVTAAQFLEDRLWQDGPVFLKVSRDEWPATEEPEDVVMHEEIRRVLVAATITEPREEQIFNWSRYSSSGKFVRTCALVLRFVEMRCPRFKPANPEVVLVRLVQMALFAEEMEQVRLGRAVKSSSKLSGYQLWIDESGVLRIKTRLSSESFGYEERNPALLGEHPYTRLLVRDTHERLLHGGVAHIMTELRQRFYIHHLRKMCRQVVADCVCCKRFRRVHDPLIAAPLPAEREVASRPFENVGVDFTGPFHTLSGSSTAKSYIALFCCLVTRAIHLELVSNLSADCFLDAFRRFVAQRQLPQVVFTDNALAFSKAKGDIAKLFALLKDTPVKNHFAQRGIDWRFSTPYAPWTGGAWERLMQVVKNPLKKVLRNQQVTFEQMLTILKEIEAVVNTRPLIAATSDVEEPPVLTPAHFLVGGPALLLPSPLLRSGASWNRRRTQIMESLWKRFRGEYLGYLRTIQRNPGIAASLFQHGEVVILDESPLPRAQWRLARVKELHMGRDGLPRSATLVTASGSTYVRSVRQLIRLEASSDICRRGDDVAAMPQQMPGV